MNLVALNLGLRKCKLSNSEANVIYDKPADLSRIMLIFNKIKFE